MKIKLRYTVWYGEKFMHAGDIVEISPQEWENFRGIADIVEKEQVVNEEQPEKKLKAKTKEK